MQFFEQVCRSEWLKLYDFSKIRYIEVQLTTINKPCSFTKTLQYKVEAGVRNHFKAVVYFNVSSQKVVQHTTNKRKRNLSVRLWCHMIFAFCLFHVLGPFMTTWEPGQNESFDVVTTKCSYSSMFQSKNNTIFLWTNTTKATQRSKIIWNKQNQVHKVGSVQRSIDGYKFSTSLNKHDMFLLWINEKFNTFTLGSDLSLTPVPSGGRSLKVLH